MIAGIVLGFVIGCLASAPYYYGEMKKLRDKHSEEARLWHSRKAGLLVQIANLKSELSEANAKMNPPKCERCKRYLSSKATYLSADGESLCPECFRKHLDAGGK